MLDAQSTDPLVCDTYAATFLGDKGKEIFNLFRDFRNPDGSNITRCYLIDEIVQARLLSAPLRRVVLVGAGFDFRAFRLKYGRWMELGEAGGIKRKEAVAPADSAPNPLTRITIDFAREKLMDALAPFAATEPVIVIVEGVLVYLDQARIKQLADTLCKLFPKHTLVCDVMQRRFFKKFSAPIHKVIESPGARFQWPVDDPKRRIEELGYRTTQRISIALRAAELKCIPIPAFVVRWLLPSLREGYSVCVFERC